VGKGNAVARSRAASRTWGQVFDVLRAVSGVSTGTAK
jgi:hypothetical protein